MKKMIDWETCKEQRFAKNIVPDTGQIKSIIESAKNKEKTAKMIPLNETTKETVVSLTYDVLRELLESLALKHGYKIYNHECYTPFLRIVIKDDDFALEFDSLRMLRNGINYYGKNVSLSDAELTIRTAEKLIGKTKDLLKIFSVNIAQRAEAGRAGGLGIR